MKTVRNNIRFILFFLAANLIFIAANIPFIEQVRNTPANAVPTYQHHDVMMDYLVYISFIRESKEGAWRIPDLYTTETTSGTGNFFYYILLGKIAGIANLSPVFIYHLARIVQYEVFIWLLYALCGKILGKTAGFLAALIALTSGPPAAIGNFTIYGVNDTGIPAWWMLNPFRRADMLPHHSASAILMLSEIILFLESISYKNLAYAVYAGTAAFFAAAFHPISAMLILVGQPLAAVWDTCFKIVIKIRREKFLLWPVLIPMLFTGLAITVIRYDIATTYPYNLWLTFDVAWYDRYVNYIRDFFTAGGILWLGVVPAIIYILSRPSGIYLITISVWAILPYAMILLSTALGVAKFRFALLLHYIPASILAVYVFRLFLKKIPAGLSRYAVIVAAGFIYLAYLIPSVPVMYREWSGRMKQVNAGMYLTHDWINAAEYLKKNIPKQSHIMVTETNGALLPAYAPVVTYVGNYMLTLDYESKKEMSGLFFLGLLTPQDALNMIKNAGITYIFAGPEDNRGDQILSYGIPLRKWFSNSTVTIYQVE